MTTCVFKESFCITSTMMHWGKRNRSKESTEKQSFYFNGHQHQYLQSFHFNGHQHQYVQSGMRTLHYNTSYCNYDVHTIYMQINLSVSIYKSICYIWKTQHCQAIIMFCCFYLMSSCNNTWRITCDIIKPVNLWQNKLSHHWQLWFTIMIQGKKMWYQLSQKTLHGLTNADCCQ